MMWITSCMKKELPVSKHQPGNVQTSVIPLTSNYKYQIYFSLKEVRIVQQQLKTSWDIAFECKGKRIILNSSKFMFAYRTSKSDFSETTDTSGFANNKTYDSPTGNLDSTAIGNWWEHNNVYIIHKGYNENGTSLGYVKFKILSYNNGTFTFSFCNISDVSAPVYFIEVDTNYRFVGFSFDTKQKVYCEPPKNSWDLLFTSYTEKLSEPYLVVGCLTNTPMVYACLTKSMSFENVNYDYAINQPLSQNTNIIGYNWKEYDFSSSAYIIHPENVYIIKGIDNFYYKLRFIDFYSSSGEKGYPKFEFQKL